MRTAIEYLAVIGVSVLLWNIAYHAGAQDIGSWTLLAALAFGLILGVFLVVYHRMLSR